MCGFAGFVSREVDPASSQILEAMGRAIAYRGPDDSGTWLSGELGIGLVHRRLAIQDLSPAGAQPMASASGRFVIAFNGEIYNFQLLRAELENKGCSFRGHSDTEVMLQAIEAWGLSESLSRFEGMFAFALVDLEERSLTLARDRMGEKPLYFGWQGNTLLFGSELKALRAHPAWEGDIDTRAITLLLRHNVIPGPLSIHKGIHKLPPASFVQFALSDTEPGFSPEPRRYWRLEACFQEQSVYQSVDDASAELETLLGNVIERQMVSDVPLGAFLSGGIDSSTVVALMQERAKQRVRTFSIGFNEPGFNEAEHAAAVAKHLGTDHTELYVTEQQARDLVPRIPEIYDEPFADSSQIPTFLVSEMTKKHVTVALSGDGGDELFCGYTRYPGVLNAWQRRNGFAGRLRKLATDLPPGLSSRLVRALVPGQRVRTAEAIRYRLQRIQSSASASDLSEFYRRSVSLWPNPALALVNADEYQYGLNQDLPGGLAEETLKTLMWRDLNWYLPDDILTKVDRAAMACSLETRIPMLAPEIVTFALGLPESLNLNAGVGKQVLRSLLYRHVPRALIDRPKQGFAVPVAEWLRGSLRDWAESLLSEQRLRDQGYWHTGTVRWIWQEHLSGRENYSSELWGILMFQAWLDHNKSEGSF